MSKVRIYELARELGADNRHLEKFVRGLGIQIKSYMSTVSEDQAQQVRDAYRSQAASGQLPQATSGAGAKSNKSKAGSDAGAAKTPAKKRGPKVIRRRAAGPKPSEKERLEQQTQAEADVGARPSAPVVRSGRAGERGAVVRRPAASAGAALSSDGPTRRVRREAVRVDNAGPDMPPPGTSTAPGVSPGGPAATAGSAAGPALGSSAAVSAPGGESSHVPASTAGPAVEFETASSAAVQARDEQKPAPLSPEPAAPLSPGATPSGNRSVVSPSAAQAGANVGAQPGLGQVSGQQPAASPAEARSDRQQGSTEAASPDAGSKARKSDQIQVGQRITLPKGTHRFRGGLASRMENGGAGGKAPSGAAGAKDPAAALPGASVAGHNPAGVNPATSAPSSSPSTAARASDRATVAEASASPRVGSAAVGQTPSDTAGASSAGAEAAAGPGATSNTAPGAAPGTTTKSGGASTPGQTQQTPAQRAQQKQEDEDRGVVRDSDGVIVGAASKRSEPKILGFIDIAPRRPKQQVIITEASQPTRQGRASARKRREEKVQQQSRRRSHNPRHRRDQKRGSRMVSTQEMSEAKKRVRVNEAISVADLAHEMGVKASRLMRTLWQAGMRGITINHAINVETAEMVAAEFGYSVDNVSFEEGELINNEELSDGPTELRAPVVTVMGHVDHGKTTLLDYIRNADVVSGEAGGITQHVGAYRVKSEAGPIVFLDTPGHEAFSMMRSRGASLTDILVLVVAADDGVMPTTKEAIKHANKAKIPIVVAINKIDKPEANPQRVKQMLMSEGVVGEEFGGDVPIVEISAKVGTGIPALLDLLGLQAEVLDLRAPVDGLAYGTVIESRIEKGRGAVSTVLIEGGQLEKGDIAVAGECSGKVRSILDDRGRILKSAGASMPVEVLGLDSAPLAGEKFNAVENEKGAKQLVAYRRDARRKKESAQSAPSALDILRRQRELTLKIVLRADVAGSVEAVKQSLTELSTGKVKVEVISDAVGSISENDVNLASAGEAVIIGFNAKTVGKATQTAEAAEVPIYNFNVIYEAVDRVRELMIDLLPPDYREKEQGQAEVRQIFPIPRLGMVAGCRIIRGLVQRSSHIRVRRGDEIVHTGKVGSLRVFKDDVREVKEGFECGIVVENYPEVEVGDILESFELETIRPTLD